MLLSVSGIVVSGCAGATVAPSETGATKDPTRAPTSGPYVRTTAPETPPAFEYVALGDSYTIGTSVKAEDRWPNQLVRTLRPDIDLHLAANLAVNGYTTSDLIAEQLPELDSLDPDFVSVLIGVNDVVRRVGPEQYRENVAVILDDLQGRMAPDRVLVVSTPDYTLTPQGPRYGDPERQSTRVRRFNAILREEAEARDLGFVDIMPVADRVPDDLTLVARDGLHPSGKQYAGWVELIAPKLRAMLSRSSGDGG